MCGCRNLSKRAKAVYVGPFVQETMGQSLSGFLCSFGKKYMVCVEISSGR